LLLATRPEHSASGLRTRSPGFASARPQAPAARLRPAGTFLHCEISLMAITETGASRLPKTIDGDRHRLVSAIAIE
jgi:hypothetical protein